MLELHVEPLVRAACRDVVSRQRVVNIHLADADMVDIRRIPEIKPLL